MFKNAASQKLWVYATDLVTGLPKTGDAANITAYLSKDFGAVAQLGDTSATEADATNAKGWYLFDLTQAETNADTVLFSTKTTTGAVLVRAVPDVVYTVPPMASGKIDVSVGAYQSGQDPATLVLAGVTEGSITLKQALNVMLAALAGKCDGALGSAVHFRDQADTKNRIAATVDASGNRSAVTIDGS